MSIPARFLLALIRAYQLTFSAVMGKSCRYHPTCSQYAAQSVRRFGAGRGMVLAGLRVCRCHPWARGGYDPVPDTGTPHMPEKFPLNKSAGYAKTLRTLERET